MDTIDPGAPDQHTAAHEQEPAAAPTREAVHAPEVPVAEEPPDHLPWAVFATVAGFLCCFIGMFLGIPAIIFANEAKTKWEAGDAEGARSAADRAQGWALAATLGDIVGFVLAAIVLVTMHHATPGPATDFSPTTDPFPTTDLFPTTEMFPSSN